MFRNTMKLAAAATLAAGMALPTGALAQADPGRPSR